MDFDLAGMFDARALVIVVFGTFLATLARCGWTDVKTASSAVMRIGKADFDLSHNRRALAPSIDDINQRGPLCTDIPLPPDRSMARIIIAFARSGSMEMLHAQRRKERAARERLNSQAVTTFQYAGELSPIFGMVGTLFAITQLSPFGNDTPVDAAMTSIATAVLSSLYGVLFAHLVCIPVGRAIERKAEREEDAREQLIDWLETSLHKSVLSPSSTSRSRKHQKAAAQ